MQNKKQTSLTAEQLERFLGAQTNVILNAVDEKIGKLEKSFKSELSITEVRIVADMDRKLIVMEERLNRKFDKLTTTLDKFLKRMTDMEDEFEIMKRDINHLKKIIQEKLGVNLSQ